MLGSKSAHFCLVYVYTLPLPFIAVLVYNSDCNHWKKIGGNKTAANYFLDLMQWFMEIGSYGTASWHSWNANYTCNSRGVGIGKGATTSSFHSFCMHPHFGILYYLIKHDITYFGSFNL